MLDPEKLLRELGEMPRGMGGDGGRAGATGTAERFCGGCWAALPPGAATCPDCGRSLAEIEASRQAKLAADHNWIPPRKQDAAGAAATAPAFATPDSNAEPPPAVVGPALPDPLAQELRRSRHHFLMAVLIGSAWGGAVMVGAWFTIKSMSPDSTPGSSAAVHAPQVGEDGQPEVKVETVESEILWNNRYETIKAELYTEKGLLIVGEGEPGRLPEGSFIVKVGPKDEEWRIIVGTVSAIPGQKVRVSITRQQAARVSQKQGDNFYNANRINSAIEAWRKAATLDPKRIDAHLRLATTLPLRDRFREAREHARAALTLDPKNSEAQEVIRLTDELDNIR